MSKFDNLKIYLVALRMNFPTIFLTLYMKISIGVHLTSHIVIYMVKNNFDGLIFNPSNGHNLSYKFL